MASGDIEEIKSRLNIIDVLRDYIRLEKAGANYRALCPFHNEKSPSFMVSEEKQMWHCFGCGKGGDIFGFVMEMEGLEFREVLKLLAEKAGIELKKMNPKLAAEKSKTLEILELATKFYETQLWNGEGKIRIINYLKERGLKDEIIKEFRLGYAPIGWRNLLTFLNSRGYKDEEILKTGLIIKKDSTNQKLPAYLPAEQAGRTGRQTSNQYYDRFRDRIIFPIADTNGKIVGFSARVTPGGDESQAKYVNTPETEVYHKSKILYGINKAKAEMRQKDFVLLVEGNMDVIASAQAGIKNTVAVSGTALTPEQIALINRYTNKVKMFFDMDSAGENATKKSIKLCFEKDMQVEVVELPEGKDAADLAQKNPEILRQAVKESKEAMEYFFNKVFSKYDKSKAQDKKIIAEEFLEMVKHFANALEKSHWIKKLAEELRIDEAILTDALKKATLKGRAVASADKDQKPAQFIPKSKSETLLEDLAGLMLLNSQIWKEVAGNDELTSIFQKDSLLKMMLEKGSQFQHSFDQLIVHAEEPEIISRAEKIFFAKKYRLGLNNELEEIIIDEPLGEAKRIISEIKKEAKKTELDKMVYDLKTAEERKDNEAASFLRMEAKKITEELNKLIS